MTLAEAEQAVIRAAVEEREAGLRFLRPGPQSAAFVEYEAAQHRRTEAVDALLALRLALKAKCCGCSPGEQCECACHGAAWEAVRGIWAEPIPEQSKAEEPK